LSAPPTIHFYQGLSTPLPVTGGEILDAKGRAIHSRPGGGA
jgi:hypothetical protein